MYSTCLVSGAPPLPTYFRDPSPWDIEKQARSAARSYIAHTQKLSELDAVRAQVASDDLADSLASRADRRRAEHKLADYIQHEVNDAGHRPWLDTLANRLRNCRQRGTLAQMSNGKTVVLWDSKCGQSRLCPDEARNETHRLIEIYGIAIPSYLRKKPGSRLYYATLTLPNFPDGRLRYGLENIYRRWNKLRKSRRNGKLRFPSLKGALCVVEAPRSARGDWNVHMNVFFVADDYFSFSDLRAAWHWNLDIKQVDADPGKITSALREAIKYAVEITPSKSMRKAESGATKAPAMTEWPPEAWLEWFESHQKYRRVRSYGALFLNKKNKEFLEIVPEPPRSVDDSDLIILGRVHWSGKSYIVTLSGVDLIREDKSLISRGSPLTNQLQNSTGPP